MRRELGLSLDSILVLAIAIAGAAAYGAGTIPHSPVGRPVIYACVVSLALYASFSGWRRARAGRRLPWICTTLSLTGFLAGEVIWRRASTGGSQTTLLLSDGAFIVSYLLLGVAAASLASSKGRDAEHSSWLDAGILTALAGLVAWSVLIEPWIGAGAVSGRDEAMAIGHAVAGLFVTAFVCRLVFSRSYLSWGAISFTLGVAAILVVGSSLRWQHTRSVLGPGSRLDVALLAGYLLIGFAALLPSGERKASTNGRHASGRGRLAIVLLAALVPQIVLLVNLVRRHLIALDTLTLSAGIATTVMVLVAVRLWRSLARVRQAEEHRSEARLSALIHNSSDAIFLVDRECMIAFASRSSESLWRRSVKSMLGTSLLESFVDEDRNAIVRQLENLVSMPKGATLPLEGRIRAEHGEVWALEGTGCNLLEDEHVGAIVLTLRDTTSRRRLEAQLERRAFHDSLTGLANRALFADRITHALNRATREPEVDVAVLLIDLDDFKAVNDGMGHGAGDELIRGVAERIQACLRPADTVARLGGDEFAVLIEGLPSVAYATQVAGRLIESLLLPIDVIGLSLAVPASIGITLATRESSVESLLRDADIALYSAKAKGKGGIVLFNEALRDTAVRRLALKVELPEALRDSQFQVVYQPIKTVKEETLRGFEALVRWHHPERGAVSPGEFIPAAEETGAIVEIGRWVLEQACRQLVQWNSRFPDPLTISVNVSGVQLHHLRFVKDLRDILEATGLEPSLLILELTESVVVERQNVQRVLTELRTIGVGISIDDFGTGYSSLSYLQNFPVTSIKVDQSFVADLATGDAGLVRSILSIAEALNLTTVAEGVEDAGQLALLDELGCDLAQGFYLGRPQSAGEIDSLLEILKMARSAQRRSEQGITAPVLLADH